MALSDSEVQKVVEEAIEINGWKSDDMIGLLAECEMALNNNEGRIEQLKARGLRKLYYIITGINKKNKIKIQETVHAIQDISFKIQKILLERIDIIASTVVYLNDKVNARINWSDDIIEKLIRKIEDLSDTQIEVRLLRWQSNIRNLTTSNGKKYIDLSEGIKILLVVSDLFGIAKGWRNLVDRPLLETTLDNLGVDELIKVSDFYGNLIYEKESLSLYVKENYDYRTVDISSYGQMIYKIDEVYSQSSYLMNMSVSLNEALADINRKINNTFDEKIRSVDLCENLINDLVCLDAAFQIEVEAEQQAIEEVRYEPKENQEESKGVHGMIKDSNENYSIFKITPEGLWLFKEGKSGYTQFTNKTKGDYSFSKKNDEEIKLRLDAGDPCMIIMPWKYLQLCNEEKNNCRMEIKNIVNKKKCISLADYYMYLWFNDTKVDDRKNKKLAFIEFYDNDLYVSGYEVDDLGTDYRKGFSGLEISKGKNGGKIKDLIRAEGIYSRTSWEDILCFKVFTADKNIDKKLIDIGVSKVVDAWEDILKTDNDTLGNIISNMKNKS
jgi:hypothetical protein